MAEQAEQQPGFEIKDRFYPWPQSFRMGDIVLIEQVTGLDWPAFTERLPEDDEIADAPAEAEDLVVLTGLMAASIWQEHSQWRRDRVVRYLEQLDLEAVKFIGGEGLDLGQEEDARPPDEPVGEKTSEISPTPSSAEPASPSVENRSSTGAAGSPTGQD